MFICGLSYVCLAHKQTAFAREPITDRNTVHIYTLYFPCLPFETFGTLFDMCRAVTITITNIAAQLQMIHIAFSVLAIGFGRGYIL